MKKYMFIIILLILFFSQSIAQIEYKAPGILKEPTKINPERQKELYSSNVTSHF